MITKHKSGLDYEQYVAIISQSGTAVPTAIVLENTTGQAISFTRQGVGWYQLLASQLFKTNQTWIIITQDGNSTGTLTQPYIVGPNILELVNLVNGTNSDGMIINIEIRIYSKPFINI